MEREPAAPAGSTFFIAEYAGPFGWIKTTPPSAMQLSRFLGCEGEVAEIGSLLDGSHAVIL
jgi:hypothetical protein